MRRLLAILFVACSVAVAAADKSVHWRDLGAVVGGNQVNIVLSDGTKVKGRAVSVEGDSLNIDSAKLGRKSIARSSIRELRVARNGSYKWRLIGTAVGAGIGIAAAAPVLAETHNEGGSNYDGAAAGLIVGLAVAGFFLGWSADRGGNVVHIVD